MVAVHHLLYGDALFLGTDGYRHTVLITTADENNVLFFESEIAHVDIGWHIYTCQMSDMYTTIGVWQSCRHSGTFEFFLFHIS